MQNVFSRPIFRLAQRALTRPKSLAYWAMVQVSHPWFRSRRIRWLIDVTGQPVVTIKKYVQEIEQDDLFLREVRSIYQKYTSQYTPAPWDLMYALNGSGYGIGFAPLVTLYCLLRILKPLTVVETGGTPGKSSSLILRALERNGCGQLWTITLDPMEANELPLPREKVHLLRPPGMPANWLVPDWLRVRQKVILGDARDCLPRLLNELGEVDMFIHDSDHSYDHMRWELEFVFPYLKLWGWMLADDIRASRAWLDFCPAHQLRSRVLWNLGIAQKEQRQ